MSSTLKRPIARPHVEISALSTERNIESGKIKIAIVELPSIKDKNSSALCMIHNVEQISGSLFLTSKQGLETGRISR
jgi:hypothetical protein